MLRYFYFEMIYLIIYTVIHSWFYGTLLLQVFGKFLSWSHTKTLQVFSSWKDSKWLSVAACCPLTYINLIILSPGDRKRITCTDRKELCTVLGGFQLQSREMNINENWNADMEMETWEESDRCASLSKWAEKARECGWSRTFKLLHIFQYLHNRQENVDIISIKKCVCPFASMPSQTRGKAGMRLERQAAWETLTGNNEDQHNGKVHSEWHFSKSIFNLRTEQKETWNKGLCESLHLWLHPTQHRGGSFQITGHRFLDGDFIQCEKWLTGVRCGWNILVCLLLHTLVNRGQRECGPRLFTAAAGRQKTRPGHTFQSASASAHKLNPRDFPFQQGGEKEATISRPLGWRQRLVGWGTPVIHSLKHFLI